MRGGNIGRLESLQTTWVKSAPRVEVDEKVRRAHCFSNRLDVQEENMVKQRIVETVDTDCQSFDGPTCSILLDQSWWIGLSFGYDVD